MLKTRRTVLIGALAVACAPTAPLSTPVDPTEGSEDEDEDDVDLPPQWERCDAPGLEADGWMLLTTLDDTPELTDVGGTAYLQVGGLPVIVAQVEPGCFAVMDQACSHEGVTVGLFNNGTGFVCPRHGAVYDLDGRVLAGPAPRDLETFPCAIDEDGGIWVQIA